MFQILSDVLTSELSGSTKNVDHPFCSESESPVSEEFIRGDIAVGEFGSHCRGQEAC